MNWFPLTFLIEEKKNYVNHLSDNLFEDLTEESIKYYCSGSGNEIKDQEDRLAKMKALRSSSALVVNLFQYWQGKDVTPILNACRLTSRTNTTDAMTAPLNYEIKFEEQFEISKRLFRFPPNIDVVISAPLSEIAIEAKFIEPYDSNHKKGIRQVYVENISFWEGLPNLYELAKEISPDNTRFRYLDAAQLIKHILGLRNDCHCAQEKSARRLKRKFHLLYLWYDVLGEEGVEHRKEREQFAEIAKKDNVKFSHITYQEVIMKLAQAFYKGNEAYCDYLIDRYL